MDEAAGPEPVETMPLVKASALLGVSVRTLQRQIDDGTVRGGVRRGRRWVDPAHVRELAGTDPVPATMPLVQAAAVLGMTVRTLQRQIDDGKVRGGRRNGRRWVDAAHVRELANPKLLS